MAKNKFNPLLRTRKQTKFPPQEDLDLAKQKSRNWFEPASGMPKGFEQMSELEAIAVSWVHKNCKFASEFTDEKTLSPQTQQEIQKFKTEIMKIDQTFDMIFKQIQYYGRCDINQIKQAIQVLEGDPAKAERGLVSVGESIDRTSLVGLNEQLKEITNLQNQLFNPETYTGTGSHQDLNSPMRGKLPSGTDPKQVSMDLRNRLKSIENITSYGDYAKYLLAGFKLLLGLLTGAVQVPQKTQQAPQAPRRK